MRTPWGSIAKIEVGGGHSGTGFLVAPGYLVTALHVVATPEGRSLGDIVLHFNPAAERDDGSPIVTMTATLEADLWSSAHDFAVLKCEYPQPDAKPFRLADRCRVDNKFSSPGFGLVEPIGFTAGGTITGLNDPSEEGGTVLRLQFDSGSGVPLKGHSGAPVIINGVVVGLLCTAFLDGAEKSVGGFVAASPIRHVVEFCNQYDRRLLQYKAAISWPTATPTVSPVMADRKQEFSEFVGMITGQSQKRILFLQGVSGFGKTRVAEEFGEYARGLRVIVASVDLKGPLDLEQVYQSFVFTAGGEVFPNAAASESGAARFPQIVEDLISLERPLLLSIDNWQDSSDLFQKWIKLQLFVQMDQMPHIIVMITGHQVPEPRAAAWAKFVLSRELSFIDAPGDWLEFCTRNWPQGGITRDHIVSLLLTAPKKLAPSAMYSLLDTLQRKLQADTPAGAGR